jgi:hypothetical protein
MLSVESLVSATRRATVSATAVRRAAESRRASTNEGLDCQRPNKGMKLTKGGWRRGEAW